MNPGVQIFILFEESDKRYLRKENDTYVYNFSIINSFIRAPLIKIFYYKLYNKIETEFNYVFGTLSGRTPKEDIKILEFKEITSEDFLKSKYKKTQRREFSLTLDREPEGAFVFYLELGNFFYSDISSISIM